jgi:hypothetical protein
LQLIWKNNLALYEIPAPPDADTLRELAQTARRGAADLRAVTDLLMVYDHIEGAADRETVKPLLEDRLRLYSGQLNDEAAAAARLANGSASLQPATKKKVSDVQSGLLSAESKLIALSASLKWAPRKEGLAAVARTDKEARPNRLRKPSQSAKIWVVLNVARLKFVYIT